MKSAVFTNSAVSVTKLQISIGKIKLKYPWLFFLQEENKIAKTIVGRLTDFFFCAALRQSAFPSGPEI